MSYASGMAIGLTIGQQLLNLFAQNQNKSASDGFNFADLGKEINYINKEIEEQSVRLAHAIKGRRRYYVNALKQNAHLAKLITTKLKEFNFVKDVFVNVNTGSLLILYSCAENIMDDIFKQLKERVFSIGSRIVELGTSTTSFAGGTLITIVKELNQWIKQQTSNVIDLKTIIAGLFIVRGLRKIMMGQRPNGPQMLWWAFSLLEGIGK